MSTHTVSFLFAYGGVQPVSCLERFLVVPFYAALFAVSRAVVIGPIVFFTMSSFPIAAIGFGAAAVLAVLISEV